MGKFGKLTEYLMYFIAVNIGSEDWDHDIEEFVNMKSNPGCSRW